MINTPFNQLTYTVVDTETTGYTPKYAKMVEIAAVKIYPDFTIDYENTFSELINPEINIPYNAYKVHNISNDMVKDKPLIQDIMPSFLSFAKASVIVGHNVNFDMRFIKHEAQNCNLPLTFNHVLDTLSLSKKAVPNLEAYKLDNLIDYFNINLNIDNSDRHRALFDAVNTAIVMIKCLEILQNKGIYSISNL